MRRKTVGEELLKFSFRKPDDSLRSAELGWNGSFRNRTANKRFKEGSAAQQLIGEWRTGGDVCL